MGRVLFQVQDYKYKEKDRDLRFGVTWTGETIGWDSSRRGSAMREVTLTKLKQAYLL